MIGMRTFTFFARVPVSFKKSDSKSSGDLASVSFASCFAVVSTISMPPCSDNSLLVLSVPKSSVALLPQYL